MLRHLIRFKGKDRILRFIYSSRIGNAKDEIIRGKFGIWYKLPNLKESLAFAIFAHGIYEEKNIRFIVDQLPRNAVMLDLGANIGSICIPIAKLRSDVRIIAVEASARVFSYLQHNIQINKITNITIVNKALSDVDDQLVSFFSPEIKFGKGSMSPVFTKDAETIETIAVDTLLKKENVPNVAFIKIDVEGYESLVFKGARELLSAENAPVILFEFAHWAEREARNVEIGDSQRILLSYRYQLFNIDNPPAIKPLNLIYETGTHMVLARKPDKLLHTKL